MTLYTACAYQFFDVQVMLGYLPYTCNLFPWEWALSIHVYSKSKHLGNKHLLGTLCMVSELFYNPNTYSHPQSMPEVIDLRSDSSDQDSFENEIFSPFKAKIEAKPIDVLKQVIPDFCEEYHNPETHTLPVLARPIEGLGVIQLL